MHEHAHVQNWDVYFFKNEMFTEINDLFLLLENGDPRLIHILNDKRDYRILSIKRPRRLFQTWHGGPGVCWNQQFVWARHYLRKGYYLLFFFLAAVCIYTSERLIYVSLVDTWRLFGARFQRSER